MTTDRARELAENYKRWLRKYRLYGRHVPDMPEDVAASALAMHQHAQLYWMYERRQDRLLSWEEWNANATRASRKDLQAI